jgi:hypothetical protein
MTRRSDTARHRRNGEKLIVAATLLYPVYGLHLVAARGRAFFDEEVAFVVAEMPSAASREPVPLEHVQV